MAKHKKSASKRNPNTHTTEEGKVSQNGTEKREPHKAHGHVQKSNAQVATKSKLQVPEHQQKKVRFAGGNNKSSIQFWLTLALFSTSVALCGVVFKSQIQEAAKNTFQLYIQPHVPVFQWMIESDPEITNEIHDESSITIVKGTEETPLPETSFSIDFLESTDVDTDVEDLNLSPTQIDSMHAEKHVDGSEINQDEHVTNREQPEIDHKIINRKQPENVDKITNRNQAEIYDKITNRNQPEIDDKIANRNQPEIDDKITNRNQPEIDDITNRNQPEIDDKITNINQPEIDDKITNRNQLEIDDKITNKNQPEIDNKIINRNQPEIDDKVINRNQPVIDDKVTSLQEDNVRNNKNVNEGEQPIQSLNKNITHSNNEISQNMESNVHTVQTGNEEDTQALLIKITIEKQLEKDISMDKTFAEDSRELDPVTEPNVPDRTTYMKSSLTNDEDFTIFKELDEADELLEKDKLEMAREKYDAILRKHISSPRAHYGKGLTLDKLGFKYMSNDNLEQAIDFLARVLQLNNVPDELLKLAGRKLADRQQFRGWGGQAVKTFKTLVQRFPEDLALRNELGVSYLMIGRNDRARDVFKEVLARDSINGFAKAHLGFILKTQDNDLEKAVELLAEGIRSGDPGTVDGRFYLHLGDSLLRLGRENEARQFFQEGEEKRLFLSAWQRSLYNVDRLTSRPWWSEEQTPYQGHLKLLRDNWKVIRDEGLAQLNAKTGSFMPEEENLRDTGDWKQFTLYQQGRKKPENCAKVPETCKLIDRIPDARGCKRGQVKFSVMSPGIHVWPHVGPTNCRIRAHLGLVVPEGPIIRVKKETRTWKEGDFIIFDDSFEHEVWHEGSELRLVLIVDFWHPELTEAEKRRLSAI